MSADRVILEQIQVGPYKNFSYLIAGKKSLDAVIFDPAWEVQTLFNRVKNGGFRLRYIINTHAHFDHIEGNSKLAALTSAKIMMHDSSLAVKDIGVKDNEEIEVGGEINLRFIHTPGHSPESMCTIVNDFALITGDTLFIGECGRVDLPGGDAGGLYQSFEKIRLLDPNLLVYPGHDYGQKRSTTLGEQLDTNYTLAKRSKDDFIRFMNEP